MGPGMLRDLFKETIDIQESIGVTTLSNENLQEFKEKDERHIAKPSYFRWHGSMPLYARV